MSTITGNIRAASSSGSWTVVGCLKRGRRPSAAGGNLPPGEEVGGRAAECSSLPGTGPDVSKKYLSKNCIKITLQIKYRASVLHVILHNHTDSLNTHFMQLHLVLC